MGGYGWGGQEREGMTGIISSVVSHAALKVAGSIPATPAKKSLGPSDFLIPCYRNNMYPIRNIVPSTRAWLIHGPSKDPVFLYTHDQIIPPTPTRVPNKIMIPIGKNWDRTI